MARSRMLTGAALVLLGVLFLFDALGSVSAGSVIARWWPVSIVALGAVQLLDQPRQHRRHVGPVIVMAVGLVLLGFSLDLIDGSVFTVLWPLALVATGVWLVVGHGRARPADIDTSTGSGSDELSTVVIFSGRELASRSQAFRGGSLVAIFGGCEVDLRGARLHADGASLDVTAVFGGVNILVPRGWKVDVRGPAVFGGYENKTLDDVIDDPEAPTLTVRVLVLFAGASVEAKAPTALAT